MVLNTITATVSLNTKKAIDFQLLQIANLTDWFNRSSERLENLDQFLKLNIICSFVIWSKSHNFQKSALHSL